MKCACLVQDNIRLLQKGIRQLEIIYCPLHYSAPDLLDALKQIADPLGFKLQSTGDLERRMNCARKAIAKATQQKEK